MRLKSPGTAKTSLTPTCTRRRARWRPSDASPADSVDAGCAGVDAIGHPGADAGQPTVSFDAGAAADPFTDPTWVSMDRSGYQRTRGSRWVGARGRPSGVATDRRTVVGENIMRFPGVFLRFLAFDVCWIWTWAEAPPVVL